MNQDWYYWKEEIKMVILVFVLLTAGILIFSFFGLSGGHGGNPQESYREYLEEP